jgi:hypothetical protein
VLLVTLADVSPLPGSTVTEVDDDSLAGVVIVVDELVDEGGGVVVLGTTTVVSLDAVVVGVGVVAEVVVVRSQAVNAPASVRAATRGISFICSPG